MTMHRKICLSVSQGARAIVALAQHAEYNNIVGLLLINLMLPHVHLSILVEMLDKSLQLHCMKTMPRLIMKLNRQESAFNHPSSSESE